MQRTTPVLRLQSQCVITRGPFRSLIIDLDRRRYETIPNDMYDLLEQIRLEKALIWEQHIEQFSGEDRDVLEEYRLWLLEREYVVECLPELAYGLRPISLEYDTPSTLDAAIIDLNSESTYSLQRALCQLDALGCKSVHIRDYDGARLGLIKEAVLALETSMICNIHLLLRSSSIALDVAIELLKSARVSSIVLHGCEESIKASVQSIAHPSLSGTKRVVHNECACGTISQTYFIVNHRCVSQSSSINTCLYKKVGIDRLGRIKNCPSSATTYGHVDHTRIDEAIALKEFQSLWRITKAQIDVCKVCEFRMICTDCRVYRKNEDNLYAKPLKCTYDPYTATWSD